VLTLLYDKTFPPRQAMAGRLNARHSQRNLGLGLGVDQVASSMRQFNYNPPQNLDENTNVSNIPEENIENLEEEVQ